MHTLIIWMWLRSELATRIHTPLEWESVHTRYYLKSFFPTPKDGSVVLGGFLSTFSIHFSIPASTLLVMISEMHGLAFFRSLSDAMTSLLFSSFSFQEKKNPSPVSKYWTSKELSVPFIVVAVNLTVAVLRPLKRWLIQCPCLGGACYNPTVVWSFSSFSFASPIDVPFCFSVPISTRVRSRRYFPLCT